MKSPTALICQLGLGILTLSGLNACYFNSAGHIIDKASHKAAYNMADIQPGSVIYTDGTRYYVELPRYRADKAVRTQYSLAEKEEDNDKITVERKNDTVMVEIPQQYALYLCGKAASPTQPSGTHITQEDADSLKRRCSTLQAVRKPEHSPVYFEYKSPAAAAWYTLGALDWLCVDLPVTCVENSLMICGVFLYSAESLNKTAIETINNAAPKPCNTSERTIPDGFYEWMHEKEWREREENNMKLLNGEL